MTFDQKLQKLRKEKGWTQEQLASQLNLSRQTLSKWESGTVIPDTEHIIRLSKIFQVSTDYLLLEECDNQKGISAFEHSKKSDFSNASLIRILIGSGISIISFLAMIILGILSSVYPAVYTISYADVPWTRVYTGLWGFLKQYRLEWLFILCFLFFLAGLGVIFYSKISSIVKSIHSLFKKN
ncbi:MAG: helix-turn-helix domain-containing protein [Massiliimalia sp.]